MQVNDAIDQMLDTSGMTKAGVSAALGKHRNYLSSTIYQGATPKIDTLANMAAAMGYKLVLVGHGEEIEIDPTIEPGSTTGGTTGGTT